MIISIAGCNSLVNVKTVPADSQIPQLGSEDWFVWVEHGVPTGDGQGHGPDYGSSEWCMVVDYKLFAKESGVAPCSSLWNEKVTERLKKMTD